MQKFLTQVRSVFGSKFILLAVSAVFVALALRTAMSKTFPLPYDEGFHFGLIKLYSTHLSPFLAQQPAGADAFGAVTRDPSYLYHYLLSFPYRLISVFVHTTWEQVFALRLLNIGFGALSLLLVRKLALKLGVSRVMANVAALGLAITPVFYNLSGQINYDNLLIPVTLLTVLMTVAFTAQVKAGRVRPVLIGQLAVVLLLASLVKYSFLPIMGMVTLYVAGLLLWQRSKFQWHIKWRSAAVVLTGLAIIISGLLWGQRYGVDMALYHTPHPQCNVVLSVADCSHYGPWYRNYVLHQTVAPTAPPVHVLGFTKIWVKLMYSGTYSLVGKNGVFIGVNSARAGAEIVLGGAVLYGLLRWRRAFRHGSVWIALAAVTVGYAGTLWAQNFSDFRHLGMIIAVQGRYLLLVLPLVYIAAARVYTVFFYDFRYERLQDAAAGIVAFGLFTRRRTLKLAYQQKRLAYAALHDVRQAFRTYP